MSATFRFANGYISYTVWQLSYCCYVSAIFTELWKVITENLR